MAQNKNSFLLYCDIIHTVKKLTDEQAGNLFKHILMYVNDENPIAENVITELTFEPIKQSLKRDLVKFENICNRNKINGLKGGRPKNPVGYLGTQENPKKPKKADSDSDSDIENIIYMSEVSLSDVENNEYLKIAKSFYDLFKKNLEILGVKDTTLKKAKAAQYEKDIRLMFEKDNIEKSDLLLIYNFLQKNDFWRKNILSISKLREKYQKLLIQAKSEVKKVNDKYNDLVKSSKTQFQADCSNFLCSIIEKTTYLKKQPLNFNSEFLNECLYPAQQQGHPHGWKNYLEKKLMENDNENKSIKMLLQEFKKEWI